MNSKNIIADYLADMEILDRKDLNQSIKETLIKINITEIKEDRRNPKKIARKKNALRTRFLEHFF